MSPHYNQERTINERLMWLQGHCYQIVKCNTYDSHPFTCGNKIGTVREMTVFIRWSLLQSYLLESLFKFPVVLAVNGLWEPGSCQCNLYLLCVTLCKFCRRCCVLIPWVIFSSNAHLYQDLDMKKGVSTFQGSFVTHLEEMPKLCCLVSLMNPLC